jgi:hypothetical protein
LSGTVLSDINQLPHLGVLKKPEKFFGALLGEADGEYR